MNLYGAQPIEVVQVMNAVAEEGQWSAPKAGVITPTTETNWTASAILSGVNLRLKQVFIGNKLNRISLLGNGWMVSFKVNRHRPRTLPEDKEAHAFLFNLAPVRMLNYAIPISERLVIHTESILSPDEFRKEMALIRMFVSEWG